MLFSEKRCKANVHPFSLLVFYMYTQYRIIMIYILETLKVSMLYKLNVKWSLVQMEIMHCGAKLVIWRITTQLGPQTYRWTTCRQVESEPSPCHLSYRVYKTVLPELISRLVVKEFYLLSAVGFRIIFKSPSVVTIAKSSKLLRNGHARETGQDTEPYEYRILTGNTLGKVHCKT
jgi:hypothetical protein